VGCIRLDSQARRLLLDDAPLTLTTKDFDLATLFLTNIGRLMSRQQILSAVWGGNYVEQTEYLRVFIRHLRKKIEKDPARPRYILTEPWVGYRFMPGK
jgi:two-component system KDP operon response regulator KdpE